MLGKASLLGERGEPASGGWSWLGGGGGSWGRGSEHQLCWTQQVRNPSGALHHGPQQNHRITPRLFPNTRRAPSGELSHWGQKGPQHVSMDIALRGWICTRLISNEQEGQQWP